MSDDHEPDHRRGLNGYPQSQRGPLRREEALRYACCRPCPRCCKARRSFAGAEASSGVDAHERNGDSGDGLGRRLGHPLDRLGRSDAAHDQHDLGERAAAGAATTPMPARLDQAGERVGRAAEERAARGPDRRPGRRRPGGSRRRARAAPGRSCRRRTGPRSATPRQRRRARRSATRPACRIIAAAQSPAGRRTKRAPATCAVPRRRGSRPGSCRRAPRRSGGRSRGQGRSCRRTPRPCGREV